MQRPQPKAAPVKSATNSNQVTYTPNNWAFFVFLNWRLDEAMNINPLTADTTNEFYALTQGISPLSFSWQLSPEGQQIVQPITISGDASQDKMAYYFNQAIDCISQWNYNPSTPAIYTQIISTLNDPNSDLSGLFQPPTSAYFYWDASKSSVQPILITAPSRYLNDIYNAILKYDANPTFVFVPNTQQAQARAAA